MTQRPSLLLQLHRDAVFALTVKYKTCNPRIFGSVLHGSDDEKSDLDLLVDRGPGCSIFALGGLQEELHQLLGIRVDVMTPGDLPDLFRDTVLGEAQPL